MCLTLPVGARAQDGPATPTFTLSPMVGISWQGDRYDQLGGDGSQIAGSLGPTDGLALGAEAAVVVTPRVAMSLGATHAWLEYLVEGGAGGATRAVGGSQNLVRLWAGLILRARPDAPGYVTFGFVGSRFDVRDPVYATNEVDRFEKGGFAGLGLDLVRGARRIRLDAKLVRSTPGAGPVEGNIWAFAPRSRVWDFVLSAGWVIGF